MITKAKLQRPEMGKFNPEMWALYEQKLQSTINIFEFYPKAKQIMDEIYRTTCVTEGDLWGRKKANGLEDLRGHIAILLKDEVHLSNMQIGILLNRTETEVVWLIARARS